MQTRLYMKEGSAFDLPASPEKSSPRSQFVMPFLVIVALIVVLIAGLYMLGSNRKANPKKSPIGAKTAVVTPTILPTVTASPSATPEPVKREDLTIAVLNGSGTAGAASGISSRLKALGYTVQRVGNADGFTYQEITVKIKPDKKQFIQQLKTDIVQSAPNSTVTVEDLGTGNVDAEVIVGK